MNTELWEQIDKIEGWLTKSEAELLYNLCTGVWCEIGCWKGKSTSVLASKGFGYAIDWFKGNIETTGVDTLGEFERNTKGLDIQVILKRMEQAVTLVTKPIQLLFLDGEHTYADTKKAFELYEPKVIAGGYIVMHDVHGYDGMIPTFPGVTQYANEIRTDPRFKHVGDANRSMALQKL